MTFANLVETLSERGLQVVRSGDGLSVTGPSAAVTPDLRQSLQEHRAEFLRLLPSEANRCEQIVSQAIDLANAKCPPAWFGSAMAWETLDDFQERMHDAARTADSKWCQQAADEYLRTCDVLFAVPKLMAWDDADPWDIGTEAVMQ